MAGLDQEMSGERYMNPTGKTIAIEVASYFLPSCLPPCLRACLQFIVLCQLVLVLTVCVLYGCDTALNVACISSTCRLSMRLAIKAGLKSGAMTQSAVDEAVYRQLLPMFAIGIFDRPVNNSAQYTNSTSAARNTLARELSANSTVLLKNEGGVLPLNPASVKNIAVLGWGDGLHVMTHGGGSGAVVPYYQASPYQAIRAKMGLPFDSAHACKPD
jgi:beta-glucosidase-like glycosyl hydrolase